MHLLKSSSAGIAGLTTALLLSKNKNYQIVVAAKHMPGDYDIEYASPWAGANYMRIFLLLYNLGKQHADGEAAVSIRGTPAETWDRNTWPVLEDLARNHPESGIHFQSKTASLNGEESGIVMLTCDLPRNGNIQSQERHQFDNSCLVR